MARALSQVYTQIRGSVGGVTYLANQHHQIVCRARTSPVDPSTVNQNKIRQSFSGAAVDWLALTDVQRIAWNDYAAGLTYPNPLGDQTLSGRLVAMGNLAFKRYIASRGFALSSVEKTAPVIPGFLALDPLIIAAPSAAGTGVGLSVGNPNAEDIGLFYWRSRVFNPTRNTFKGPWSSASMGMQTIVSETTGQFDIMVGSDDNVIFVYLRAIVDDGAKRVSQPVILRGIIDTTAI